MHGASGICLQLGGPQLRTGQDHLAEMFLSTMTTLPYSSTHDLLLATSPCVLHNSQHIFRRKKTTPFVVPIPTRWWFPFRHRFVIGLPQAVIHFFEDGMFQSKYSPSITFHTMTVESDVKIQRYQFPRPALGPRSADLTNPEVKLKS